MVKDADIILEKLKPNSDRQGPVFKMKNDPRITSIGKILRRYSIDEFPQFINVLRGGMSIVGPRPQVIWEAEHYDKWRYYRCLSTCYFKFAQFEEALEPTEIFMDLE